MKKCPKCIGEGSIFLADMSEEDPEGEFEICNYCKGDGKVNEDKFNKFNPIDEVFDN